MNHRVLAVALLVVTMLCGPMSLGGAGRPSGLRLPRATFAPGDIILRQGRGARTRVVLASGGGTWSHAGILVRGRDAWFVAHAAPADLPGGGRALLEPLESFLGANHATRAMVVRVRNATVGERGQAERGARDVVARHASFDGDFDLDDSTAVYCTELVAIAWRRAGVDLAKGRSRALHIGTIRRRVLYPSDVATDGRMMIVAVSTPGAVND